MTGQNVGVGRRRSVRIPAGLPTGRMPKDFGDGDLAMAEINKLSVGKALEKLRESDQRTSKNARRDEKAAQLAEEIARMREQRLRLERHQRSRK